MELENGKTYKITHSRKGRFVFKATSQDDEWVNGEIVSGAANAILDYNVREAGDPITIRKSFIRNAVPV